MLRGMKFWELRLARIMYLEGAEAMEQQEAVRKKALEDLRWTPIERKMMILLLDSEWHPYTELHGCLWDDMAEPMEVGVHICNIRKKLKEIDRGIERGRRDGISCYRYVTLVPLVERNQSQLA